jgi:transposase
MSPRRFSAEFRVEAVRLMKQRMASGDSLARVGQELDIKPDLIRSWARDVDAAPEGASPKEIFPGKGNYRKYTPKEVEPGEIGVQSAEEEKEDELRRLRREVDLLRRERDFLKKAAAFFAKESQ